MPGRPPAGTGGAEKFADAFLNKYFEKVIRLSVTAPSAVIFAASEWLST
jgi:hypothetical protein